MVEHSQGEFLCVFHQGFVLYRLVLVLDQELVVVLVLVLEQP
jgi:hypothetical protein